MRASSSRPDQSRQRYGSASATWRIGASVSADHRRGARAVSPGRDYVSLVGSDHMHVLHHMVDLYHHGIFQGWEEFVLTHKNAEAIMDSHAEYREFKCWVLKEEDLENLLAVMGGTEDDSELKITVMCQHSARMYNNWEEFKIDENANEDAIECVYLEVRLPERGIRELQFHHVGVKSHSATIVVKVTEHGPNALEKRNEIIRKVRRLKPWWSWIAELQAEDILILLTALSLGYLLEPISKTLGVC